MIGENVNNEIHLKGELIRYAPHSRRWQGLFLSQNIWDWPIGV